MHVQLELKTQEGADLEARVTRFALTEPSLFAIKVL
jgi:hypothetical protein